MTESDPGKANRRWMPYVLLGALVSWAGWWAVIQLPINAVTKTAFLALLFVAVALTLVPAVAYLNARFGHLLDERVYRIRFVRQSLLGAAFVVVAAWLQMQRVLSVTLALILMAVFVLTETFLITREAPPQEP
jgi:hypothetical protein